jgi:TRAP-type transport system small permease protein
MSETTGTGAGSAPLPLPPGGPGLGHPGSRVDRALRRLSHLLHALAGVTMLLLLLWTVADIIGRTFLARPLPGTVELTELAVVVLVYLGLARAEHERAHIAVDLLFVRLGTRTQLVVRVLAGLLSAAVVLVLTWRLLAFSGQLRDGGFTTGVLSVPLYPVALIGVAGAGVFALAILGNVAHALRALVTDR